MTPTTTDPNDPGLGYGTDEAPGPQNEKYLVLPEADRAKGFVRPVRRSYIHLKCGTVTTMSQDIAETYVRSPKFYGSTYCTGCRMHMGVAEFRWEPDGSVVGS